VRGLQRKGQRDRAPAATEVEDIAPGRGGRNVREKNLGTGVDAFRTENPVRRRQLIHLTSKWYVYLAKTKLCLRDRREIMLTGHAKNLPKYEELGLTK
jgi:hypothetical protein